jgi:predicted RNase H-like nuclease
VRAVLDAANYADALALSRRHSGIGLSVQAWNLVPKIKELDARLTPQLQRRIAEAHPESSFAELAGHPLLYRKSTSTGQQERRALLRPHFPNIDELVQTQSRYEIDVLDACAAAWTARRIAAGTARWFGDDQRDGRGLRMIVAV